MATKKPAKKVMNKKSMKKTKGGLIGLLVPAVQKVRATVQDNSIDLQGFNALNDKTCDGSV